jgi:hypothetical protein
VVQSESVAEALPSRFVLPRIRFIPGSLTYSVPLFLNRRCGRTPAQVLAALHFFRIWTY